MCACPSPRVLAILEKGQVDGQNHTCVYISITKMALLFWMTPKKEDTV